ncbi:DEAD/DEAH box helicase [Pseudomonas aeruginosa]
MAQQTLKEVERFAQFTFTQGLPDHWRRGLPRCRARACAGSGDHHRHPRPPARRPRAGNLPLQDIEVLVLDEADRMLDMGFADDVLALANACPAERQTLLFSATHSGAGLNKVIAEVLHAAASAAPEPGRRAERECPPAGHHRRRRGARGTVAAMAAEQRDLHQGHRLHQYQGLRRSPDRAADRQPAQGLRPAWRRTRRTASWPSSA